MIMLIKHFFFDKPVLLKIIEELIYLLFRFGTALVCTKILKFKKLVYIYEELYNIHLYCRLINR